MVALSKLAQIAQKLHKKGGKSTNRKLSSALYHKLSVALSVEYLIQPMPSPMPACLYSMSVGEKT